MKRLNLFGLLVAGACTFQACHSPEARGAKDDSLAKDSTKTDTSSGKTDTSKMTGVKPVVTSSKDSMKRDDLTNQSKVDGDEASFMNKAAIGGMMEVDLGKLAQKSANPKVKAFGQQMITDHGKANAALKTLAYNSKIILPSAYPADEKAHMDAIKQMSGAAFDKHYIDMMVTDHDQTLALFKGAVKSQDKPVSDFAKKTIPVIEEHYKEAKDIQAGLK